MDATVKIDLSTPQAISLVNYLETLPFAQVRKTKTKTKTKTTPPCQYTVEEVGERVMKAEEEISAGHYYTTEEVFKPYEKWL